MKRISVLKKCVWTHLGVREKEVAFALVFLFTSIGALQAIFHTTSPSVAVSWYEAEEMLTAAEMQQLGLFGIVLSSIIGLSLSYFYLFREFTVRFYGIILSFGLVGLFMFLLVGYLGIVLIGFVGLVIKADLFAILTLKRLS